MFVEVGDIVSPATRSTGKTPPCILGASILFWGWHVGLLPYAVAMATIIELTRWVPWRWQVAEKDFNRLTDFTSVGFVLVIIYQFDIYAFHAIYAILELLPMVLFVLLAVQLYSTEEGVRLTTLFLSVRRAVARGHLVENRTIDLSYSYVVVCLIAASAGEIRSVWFIAGVFAITAYALFWHRPKGGSVMVWGCLLVAVAVGGFFGHKAALKLRWMLEPAFVAWFQDAYWANRSPFRGHTAIGAIGNLKLSERIVLRVKPGADHSYPTLLRNAVYQTFNRNTWISRTNTFKDLKPVSEGTVWPLHPGTEPGKRVSIASYLKRGRGLITVPGGAFKIERLGVEDLGISPLGVLQTKRGPGLIDYVVRYNPGTSHEDGPQTHDLYVPSYYEELFDELVAELELAGLPPGRALSRVEAFFAGNFRYSLVLRGGATTPLRHFLTKSRVGHCEYFATSTVMLLRALGIPARYATGFSVQEWSPLEKRFVVRRRHAHSWTLAYVDGRWVDVDTTPVVWAELEAQEAPWWASLYDLWSWSGFQFSRWRWSETGDEETNPVLVWLILPLAVILVWRLSRQNRIRLGRRPSASPVSKHGEDSAFYRIEQQLTEAGFERGAGETIRQWLTRWSNAGQLPGAEVLLYDIVPLHYRYRFDPAGLTTQLNRTLRTHINGWLAQHPPAKT